MKKLSSHFWYSPTQRNGILILIFLIIGLQVVYLSVDFSQTQEVSKESVTFFRNKLDSLSKLSVKETTQIIYPFNPNFITDYKGYQLGMSVDEIDRLHAFRAQGKFVNSNEEFQNVTKLSDSLLKEISSYFKFPDWVRNKNKPKEKNTYYQPIKNKNNQPSTKDLNLATSSDLELLPSIHQSLAERIVKYREKLRGFYFEDQLNEVWRIQPKQVNEILSVFSIQSKPTIQKININTATFKQVLSLPYIDYDLCKKLFEYRDEVAELQSISEIKNIDGFPIKNYDRIVLYLHAE